MIIISWYCRHRLLQNINNIFLCSVAKNSTCLTYNMSVKTNSCVYVAGVKCFLFAFWVKGQSCWNGQEIASSSDSLPVCIQVSHCDLRPLSSLSEASYKFCCWDVLNLWVTVYWKCSKYLNGLSQTKDARKTNTTGSSGAVTCSTNGYIVLVEKWAAGRLFPAMEAPVTNSLRKALMTPRCIQTNITHCAGPSLQRSLDTWMHLVQPTKGVKAISWSVVWVFMCMR